jgi:hypothetical protein
VDGADYSLHVHLHLVYNHTGGSILLAALLHGAINGGTGLLAGLLPGGFGGGMRGLGGGLDTPLTRRPKAPDSSPDPEPRCSGQFASVGKTDVAGRRVASWVAARLLLRGYGQLIGTVVAALVRSAGLGVPLDLPPQDFLVALRRFQEPLPQRSLLATGSLRWLSHPFSRHFFYQSPSSCS